jgi:hypothetical protein
MTRQEDNQIYPVDIPVKIDVARVIKELKLRPGNRRVEKMAAELTDKARAAAHPKGIYRVSRAAVIDRNTVDIDGQRFTSRALSKCLEDQPVVYPLIVTAGRELDDLPVSPDDLMQQYIMDTIKMLILFSASDYLTGHIKTEHSLGRVAALNPGEFDDFPISQQRPLFALFGGAEKQIGVSLTPGGAIKPVKSSSGIVFPNDTGFLSCRLCTQLKCPGRRAAYDPAAVREYLGTSAGRPPLSGRGG